jgi:hypothetical protein
MCNPGTCRICDDDNQELCLFMHDFAEAVENDYALWYAATYPEPPERIGGSVGHRAGHEAFLRALKIGNLAQHVGKHATIELAPQSRIDEYEEEVGIVLAALAKLRGDPVEDALVTDESIPGDFGRMTDDDWRALSETLGMVVRRGEYIWQIAARLREKKAAE